MRGPGSREAFTRAAGRAACAALSAALAGCAPEAEELPPLGEALLVVDTDAPATLAARLRIDVFAGDGTWLDTRDLSMASADAWPGSFSVYAGEGESGKAALVRLRTYPEGRVRDYLGERFSRRPTPGDPATFPPPPPFGDGLPRLVSGGADVTPASEPEPALAIDRLVAVSLDYGRRGSATVTLRSACFGTMADLAARQTCAETEALLAPVASAETSDDLSITGRPSEVGSADAALPCAQPPRAAGVDGAGAPLFDEEVCVPGGLFVLGSHAYVKGSPAEEVATGSAPPQFGGVPERIARVPPLRVDRYEVTVGRWRHAVATDGFIAPDPSPQANDAPFPTTIVGAAPQELCTYSSAPLGRETYPVSCITWISARAFCRFYGGELPTEAQWERVATASGRASETLFPWGNDAPVCDRGVYGRADSPSTASFDDCLDRGFGPQPVDSAEALADVTPGLGLQGLGGNLAEWMLDAYLSYGTLCWASQPIADPRCWSENPPYRSYRGGEWTSRAKRLRSVARYGLADGDLIGTIGFRCVRPG